MSGSITSSSTESCGNCQYVRLDQGVSPEEGRGREELSLYLLVADSPVKSEDYVNIIKTAKMGVTNLQSKSQKGIKCVKFNCPPAPPLILTDIIC